MSKKQQTLGSKARTSPTQRESLEQVMRKLEIENAKRKRKNLAPLSYGTYVAQRDGWLKKR